MNREKVRTFGLFVTRQVQRAEALPASLGYIFSEAAQMEIANYLIERVCGRADAVKRSDLQWLEESPGARKVKAVMDEIMQGDQAPTIASVRATWERLHSASKPINYGCRDCSGSGWAIVEANGAQGAIRCPRGCVVPPEKVQAAGSATERDEQANVRMAQAFGQDLAAKLAKSIAPVKEPPPLERPITEADLASADRFKS